ncbi:protein delta homolog 1-like [Littorina saxatilis]|uniref:protein delta homolog 1-like n=1 Tax=Littorina saxatilis TaxID=31220 RepID=UPI0038B64028
MVLTNTSVTLLCLRFVILTVLGGQDLALTTLAAGQFRCSALGPGEDQYFYNPDNCTKFYKCEVTNEIPAVQDCPAPLVFNPNLNLCDWEYNSLCGDGSTTPCTSAPCLNGGGCLVSGSTTYACSCATGFSGENCQISAGGGNACSPSPCQNGGTCTLSGSSYFCTCPSGYTGTNCNVSASSPCSPNPCLNSGVCNANGGTYTCSCIGSFAGPNCSGESCVVLSSSLIKLLSLSQRPSGLNDSAYCL